MSDEGLEAVRLDLILAVDAELLLNLKLNGQTVCIPTRLTKDALALHSLVTGYHILDYSSKHVTDVGLTVCGRRSVEEGVIITALSVGNALLEDFVFFPEFSGSFFSLDKVQVCRDLLVNLHFFSFRV